MADVAANEPVNQSTRDVLGTRIVVGSTIGLVVVAVFVLGAGIWTAIISENKDAALDTGRMVFSALLPLFGTWVGTVLAFYFSKENFKVASDATRDIVKAAGIGLADTDIKDAMIPRAAIVGPVSAPKDKLEDVKLPDIEAAFQNTLPSGRRVTRVLIFGANNKCMGVIHRSVWNESFRIGQNANPPVDFTAHTLKGVLGLTSDTDPRKTYKDVITALAYVPFTGTLADAKKRMESIDGCQDVVVTETGQPSEPMLGWITNVKIGLVSRA